MIDTFDDAVSTEGRDEGDGSPQGQVTEWQLAEVSSDQNNCHHSSRAVSVAISDCTDEVYGISLKYPSNASRNKGTKILVTP